MQFTETSLWKPQGVAGGSTSDSAGVTSKSVVPSALTRCQANPILRLFHFLSGIYIDTGIRRKSDFGSGAGKIAREKSDSNDERERINK